jgi:hypothetical protein
MPGTEVVMALPDGMSSHRHARRTIRGVLDRHGRLTFYSPVTRGHLRISLHDLRRAGYTIRQIEPA